MFGRIMAVVVAVIVLLTSVLSANNNARDRRPTKKHHQAEHQRQGKIIQKYHMTIEHGVGIRPSGDR